MDKQPPITPITADDLKTTFTRYLPYFIIGNDGNNWTLSTGTLSLSEPSLYDLIDIFVSQNHQKVAPEWDEIPRVIHTIVDDVRHKAGRYSVRCRNGQYTTGCS